MFVSVSAAHGEDTHSSPTTPQLLFDSETERGVSAANLYIILNI